MRRDKAAHWFKVNRNPGVTDSLLALHLTLISSPAVVEAYSWSCQCCGSKPYHSSSHVCCGGNIYPKPCPCCGGKPYNPSSHICCGGSIYSKLYRCCGGKPYNYSSQDCCGRTAVYDKNRQVI